MPYIVKSSLDIGGKIIPWNEQEVNKLIKEKEEKLEKQNIVEQQQQEELEEIIEEQQEPEIQEKSEEPEVKNTKNETKKKGKAGDK